jgi:hypothetical protein
MPIDLPQYMPGEPVKPQTPRKTSNPLFESDTHVVLAAKPIAVRTRPLRAGRPPSESLPPLTPLENETYKEIELQKTQHGYLVV